MPFQVFLPCEFPTAFAERARKTAILPLPLHDLMIIEFVHNIFRLLSRDLLNPFTTTEDEDEVALRELEGLLSKFSLESTFCFLRDLLTPLVDVGIVVGLQELGRALSASGLE